MLLLPDHIWTGTAIHTGWAVEVDGDHIVGLSPAPRHPEGGIRLPGRMLMPGLVDAHSHAFQRAFRGHVQGSTTPKDDFWTWRDAMYRTANGLDPDGVEAVSRLVFLELIRAGVTTVGEFHYLHHAPDGAPYADPDELAHRVIAAARDVGLRIVLLRCVYATAGIGRPLGPEQRRFRDDAPEAPLAAVARIRSRWAGDAGVRVGLAPHSVRAVPAAWLSCYADFDGPIHAHVAEQPAEVAACFEATGRSPLAVFADAGLVDARFTAVHLTHPSEGDVDRLVAGGATIAVCPGTELDLGDGFLPLDARRAQMCVGTDSHAASDLLAEARALELHGRGLAQRRIVLAGPGEPHGVAERILAAATLAGDRALGGAARGLAPGAPADFVAVDLRGPDAAGVPPLEAAALLATPAWIDRVWVAGREVVTDGKHPHQDAIVAAARPYLGA